LKKKIKERAVPRLSGSITKGDQPASIWKGDHRQMTRREKKKKKGRTLAWWCAKQKKKINTQRLS